MQLNALVGFSLARAKKLFKISPLVLYLLFHQINLNDSDIL
jgi:hypothetical protein